MAFFVIIKCNGYKAEKVKNQPNLCAKRRKNGKKGIFNKTLRTTKNKK